MLICFTGTYDTNNVQGNLPPEKSAAICIISYVISIILGILGALLTTGKIAIKNKNVRSTLKL